MKRFYILLAVLFLAVMAWEAGSQNRQRINEDRLWIGTNAATADDLAYTIYSHGKVLIQEVSNGGPASLMLRATSAAGSGAGTIFAIVQTTSGQTNFAVTSHGEAIMFGGLAIGATNDPIAALVGTGVGLRVFQGAGRFDTNLFVFGNVGIGTNVPTARLEVLGNTSATNFTLNSSGNQNQWLGLNGNAHYNPYNSTARGGMVMLGDGYLNIDSDNNSTTAVYDIRHGSATGGSGTLIARFQEDGLGLMIPERAIVHGRFSQTNRTLAYTGSGAAGTNVLVDCLNGNWFKLTMTNNAHLLFTNVVEGYSAIINLRQDATGSRLLTFNNVNVNTNEIIVLSTAAGSLDILNIVSDDIGTNANVIAQKNFTH